MLKDLLPATKNLVTCFGLPMSFQGSLFNVTAVVADGRILGFVPKKHLAGDGVHYEPRWFKAWPGEHVREIEIFDEVYPIGDLFFDFNGIKIGFEICEEAWVADRPGAKLARRGVDLILNPSASHFAFGKIKIRQSFVGEGSRAFNVGYVYSNLQGNEAGRIIFDGGVLIADGGQIINQGPRLCFQDVSVTNAFIDVGRNRVVRARTASHQPDLFESEELSVEVDYAIPDAGANAGTFKKSELAKWEHSPHVKEEEFTRAVSLGLFDFVRKSHQQGFVISLSGGVDSAAVTLLCRTALDLAVEELGFKGLQEKLKHIPFAVKASTVDQIAKDFITTAYQGTINSSKETLEAARAIAADAAATFHEWTVDPVLNQYSKIAEGALGEKLSWQKHDAAMQNIQARARGPGIWILANVKSALLLATSNRSEAAVGYATMDGDTCGGISPIGGIDKNFLRRWAHWMKDSGPTGLRAYGSFAKVLQKAPTAELRPLSQNQTDEDDLMPYDVLDRIEKLAIRDKKSPLECYETLKSERPQESKLAQWVAKFFRLWCRNQWKRERYAPAFHLDDESLDPKTWCRFPILMSGFEEELQDLEKAAGKAG
jgi:NAD+ synthase (glutamine-hydrolysing)